MQPDNRAMLKSSSCFGWIHYICTDLPIYMLYPLANLNRKFTRAECVKVIEEWLAMDLELEKVNKTVSCTTQTYINTLMNSTVQVNCQ